MEKRTGEEYREYLRVVKEQRERERGWKRKGGEELYKGGGGEESLLR